MAFFYNYKKVSYIIEQSNYDMDYILSPYGQALEKMVCLRILLPTSTGNCQYCCEFISNYRAILLLLELMIKSITKRNFVIP